MSDPTWYTVVGICGSVVLTWPVTSKVSKLVTLVVMVGGLWYTV